MQKFLLENKDPTQPKWREVTTSWFFSLTCLSTADPAQMDALLLSGGGPVCQPYNDLQKESPHLGIMMVLTINIKQKSLPATAD